MLGRYKITPESDAVYAELVVALFDIEGPTWLAGFMFTGLGLYLALKLDDPLTGALALAGFLLLIPRMLLLRRFRRARRLAGGAAPDVATAAMWENRYAMGLILFSALISALSLRMFAIAEPAIQMLPMLLMFAFAAGVIVRVSLRPLICALALAVTMVPTIVAAWLDHIPYHQIMAIGLVLFLIAAVGTARQSYDAARRHITTAHDMALVARIDPLTGLLNRFGLRQAFAGPASGAAGTMLAVHYCDLDGFKPVNDRHGHPAGDIVLVQVARRLTVVLRPTDLAARIGGDEFVVVQAPVTHRDEVAAFAADLAACFVDPYMVASDRVRVGASIGSAVAALPHPDLDRLLAEADRALYAVKQDRRGMI